MHLRKHKIGLEESGKKNITLLLKLKTCFIYWIVVCQF
jgi:hypothetical protein